LASQREQLRSHPRIVLVPSSRCRLRRIGAPCDGASTGSRSRPLDSARGS
jgi:hypothetical protein